MYYTKGKLITTTFIDLAMVSSKILLFTLPILSAYATTFECEWLGHCVGAVCTNFDDCSDSLACENGHCQVPNAPVDPFTVTLSTWVHSWQTVAPEGCKHDCNKWSGWVNVNDLLISGEHFNIGTGNVKIEVREKDSNAVILSTMADAVEAAGKIRGSFTYKTYLAASFNLSATNAYVKVQDVESGQWSDPDYFAYRKGY